MKSIRTPLGIVRGLGSAKKGTGEFIALRLTSIALTILTIAFIWIIVSLNGAPYPVVVARLSSPFAAIVLIAGILATVVHMRIGMQVIIEDYVHDETAKFALLMANTFFAVAVGLASAFAILMLSFKV